MDSDYCSGKEDRGDAKKTRILLFANWVGRNVPFQARRGRGFFGEPVDQGSVNQRVTLHQWFKDGTRMDD